MSHTIWFHVPLICANCEHAADPSEVRLQSGSFNPEPEDLHVEPGSILEASLGDFDDAFLWISPPQGSEVSALETWACPRCRHVHWARLVFEQLDDEYFRFVCAETVRMDAEQVQRAHYLSRMIDTWIDGNPDAGARSILVTYGHLVPWVKQTPS